MPNHLHGIIILENDDIIHNDNISMMKNTENYDDSQSMNDPMPSIESNPFYRLPKSISSFIGGFKSSVNSKIDDYIDAHNLDIPKYNRNNHFFQPNYHDKIIRNENAHQTIKQYIINNPENWDKDKFK